MTPPVKFGVHLATVSPKGWMEVAEAADQLGFESVWLPEHLVIPLGATGSPHHGVEHPPIPSDVPTFDAFGMMAAMAVRTSRVLLGTNVYNVGLRHPFVIARAAVTVDHLSGGRLAFGIGASWLRQEWEAVGLDFDTRGARVDETIEVLRRLWTEDVVEHHGRFFDFGPTAFEPKPVQQPLPLHIGGDGPAALRRAATVGAGWMPMNHSLEELPAAIAELKRRAADAGRTDPIEISITTRVTGPDDVERHVAAGVDRLIVSPWERSREAVEGMRRFAETYLQS